ncbi:MAG TPA: hypothetical protein VFX30_01320 [bacterium]|nr:hypothetical protein [bacterium]
MSYLGVLDARLLMGFSQASLYGTEAVAYASLLHHQGHSPFSYDLPPAWAIPPRATGGCRRTDLRRAFNDLTASSDGEGMIIVRGSPLLEAAGVSQWKTVASALQLQPGQRTRDCERFLAAVSGILSLHENMGAFAMVTGQGVLRMGEDEPEFGGNAVRVRAETHHSLGHQPLRIQLTLPQRPKRYWGKDLTVHAIANRRGERLQISGQPRVVDEVERLFPSLLGLVQYLNHCVQPFDAEVILTGREERPLFTRLRSKQRPPKIQPSFPMGDVHLLSSLASGEARFHGPLILWAGTYRDSLESIDRQMGLGGYVLLCERHDVGIINATPNCRYRLSSALEAIESPALRWAEDRRAGDEPYVFAHGVRSVGDRGFNRYVTLSTSGEELSMMVGKVRLTANGRDAGVEFLY